MSNIVPVNTGSMTLADPKRLKLIRDTVAKQCNEAEFNWFIDICRHTRLDPLRKQIYVFVFHAKDAAKRQMVPVTAIGGLRAIAARTGAYRADNRAPRIEFDPAEKSHLNPLGIVKAEVSVFQKHDNEWFEIVGEAYWAEFAPIVDEWGEDDTGRRSRTGKQILDPKKEGWTRMPRLMIAKCAEALALRKAWPDDLGNLYEETEIDRHSVIDLTPSEITEKVEVERKLDMIGGANAVTIDWCDASALGRIPEREFWDASLRWMRDQKSATIEHWLKRNVNVRGEMKAKFGSHYLDWQKEVERLLKDKRDAEHIEGPDANDDQREGKH